MLTLAYPETVVSHADEWYSGCLRYFGIGNRYQVRAGHAALMLINKSTGVLEYHDFGRYITSEPNGRVRGGDTDHELNFPMAAKIIDGRIENLKEILIFLATKPKLTHGEGTLYASVCDAIDYQKTRKHIDAMQDLGFIRYAAFIKKACNCARFVTDTLIAGTTNETIKTQLHKSKRFTPSTIGNVVIADTQSYVFEVSDKGVIGQFKTSIMRLNRTLFLDRLKGYKPSKIGTLIPKENDVKQEHAQWLSGIAAGAWFELYDLNDTSNYRFRRISPDGHVDVDAVYCTQQNGFNYEGPYSFIHYSNCKFFHIEQNEQIFRFDLKNFNRKENSQKPENILKKKEL